MNPVCRASGVISIGCPFPSNGVFYLRLKLDILYSNPQPNEFLYLCRCCHVTDLCSDLIQLPLCSSCRTVLFFLRTSMNMCGAKYLGASPSNQLWCQKRALLPLPIVTVVEELKRSRSASLHGTPNPTQGLGSWPHSCHSHLRRNALPNLSRSGTPNPPKSFGLHTVDQFTRLCPLLTFSSPFQRNDLLILSKKNSCPHC